MRITFVGIRFLPRFLLCYAILVKNYKVNNEPVVINETIDFSVLL